MSAVGGRNRKLFLAGALLVAGGALAVVLVGGIGRNLVYYWGPTELLANGAKAVGATIRLGGLVAPGSVVLHEGSGLEFDVTDGRAKVHVKSQGVPPQMFRERIGVVVEGTLTSTGGHFECQRLMVSHSNEYRAPDDKSGEEQLDMRKLMRSLQEQELQGLRPSGAPYVAPHAVASPEKGN